MPTNFVRPAGAMTTARAALAITHQIITGWLASMAVFALMIGA